MCKDEGMALAPWGALGGGKFKTEEQRNSDVGRKVQASEIDIQVSKVLEKIATRKSTAITSVALAYVAQKTPYVYPIVGGRTVEHLKHNIEALTLQLTEEDLEEIESAYPFDIGFPNSMLWGAKPSGSQQKIWLIESAAHYEYVPEPKVC
jgi:aryl-alcohol dehydrogenase-like predicted oxidoreductase